jgi:5'(3')-deoxyribonucleotidase
LTNNGIKANIYIIGDKMTILFDLDGVLADIHTPWLEAYNKDFNDNLKPEDIVDWDIKQFVKDEAKTTIMKYINKEGFYTNVKPIPVFVEEAQTRISLGDNVGICTSCNNNPVMIAEKLKWIKKHLPFIDRNNIMFVNNKGLANADILIDDRVLNLERFLKSNPKSRAVLVKAPHNRDYRDTLKSDRRVGFTSKEY